MRHTYFYHIKSYQQIEQSLWRYIQQGKIWTLVRTKIIKIFELGRYLSSRELNATKMKAWSIFGWSWVRVPKIRVSVQFLVNQAKRFHDSWLETRWSLLSWKFLNLKLVFFLLKFYFGSINLVSIKPPRLQ